MVKLPTFCVRPVGERKVHGGNRHSCFVGGGGRENTQLLSEGASEAENGRKASERWSERYYDDAAGWSGAV